MASSSSTFTPPPQSALSQLRLALLSNKKASFLSSESDPSSPISINGRLFHRKTSVEWRLKKGTLLSLDSLFLLLDHLCLLRGDRERDKDKDKEKEKRPGPVSDYISRCKKSNTVSLPFLEWASLQDYFRSASASQTTSTLSFSDYLNALSVQESQEKNVQLTNNVNGWVHNDETSSSVVAPTSSAPVGHACSPSSQSPPNEAALAASAAVERKEVESELIAGTFVDSSLSSIQSKPSLMPPSDPRQWTLRDTLAQERVVLNRVSVLQGKRPLNAALELWEQVQQARAKRRDLEHRESKTIARSGMPPPVNRPVHLQTPLIIVPTSTSSAITLYNVAEFLESGTLIPSSEARAKERKKLTRVQVKHFSIRNRADNVIYDVLDDTTMLKPNDWKRVVAVFVAGPEWQFDGWPFTSLDPVTQKQKPNPAKIFEAICAFHVHYDNEQLHPNVLNWKLHKLTMARTQRLAHNDRSQCMEFWNTLTDFMTTRPQFQKLGV